MILRVAILSSTASGTLLLHPCSASRAIYLGQGIPLYPDLPVTVTELALTAPGATLPIPVVVALARRLRLRWIALPPIVLLWLRAAMVMIEPFAVDFGTAWRLTEPLRELLFHTVHTPAALPILLSTTAWTLDRAHRT